MSRGARVRVTRTFVNHLDVIRELLIAADDDRVFERLLLEIQEQVIPQLAAFPGLGRDFLARAPRSIEGRLRLDRLRDWLGPHVAVRELIHGEHLILYATRSDEVFLLAIRHHRQLAFDFLELWVD
jgi:plasmid stabilization system protein ParE